MYTHSLCEIIFLERLLFHQIDDFHVFASIVLIGISFISSSKELVEQRPRLGWQGHCFGAPRKKREQYTDTLECVCEQVCGRAQQTRR
jgi:hypothetical protein